MSTNAKKKYNTSTKTRDWFPFPKYIFETSKHPILLNTNKCSSSIEALFCQQEIEQINGIANSLQCEMRDAVRIALFEVAKNVEVAHPKTCEKAKAGSSVKGHEGRKTTKRFNLPKSEKDQAEQAAKELGITIKEFLRLAIIWLADGIKEESITRLTDSKRIDPDAVAKKWSRDNQGKPPSQQVANFKKARDEAQALIEWFNEIRRHKQHSRKDELGKLTWSQRQMMDAAEADAQRHWEDQFRQFYEELTTVEQFAWDFMRANDVDWDTALVFAEVDLSTDGKTKKMSAKEQLQLIKEGRAKARMQIQELVQKRNSLVKERIQQAGKTDARKDSPTPIDLVQRKKDQDIGDQIRKEEDQKDLEAYLNDPMLWDENDRIQKPLR